MKETKVAVYMRVGSSEQLKKAWIYERINNDSGGALQKAQMREFRKLCEKNGYTVVGETTVFGSGKESLPHIQSILCREKDLQYLLCPSARSISRNLDELFEAIDYMKAYGVTLKYKSGTDLVEVSDAFRNIPQALLDFVNHLEAGIYDEESGVEESDEPQLSM